MTATEEKRYIETLTKIYEQANLVCSRFPNTDRETVVQSMLMEKKTPLEKLNFALMRASEFKKTHAH